MFERLAGLFCTEGRGMPVLRKLSISIPEYVSRSWTNGRYWNSGVSQPLADMRWKKNRFREMI